MKLSFNLAEKSDYSIINQRDVLYLDINIWIDLAECKTTEAYYAQDLIRLLVNDGKIFCPLNFPVLSELYTQNEDSMLRVSTIMNEFSLNFSFVNVDEIWEKEIEIFIYSFLDDNEYKITFKDIFVPYIAYLSKLASLDFPANFSKKDAIKLTEMVKKEISNVTLPDMVKLTKGFKSRKKKDYSQNIQDSWRNLWNYCNGDKRKIRIETENFIANNKLLPVIRKINSTLSPEQLLQLTNYLKSFPKTDRDRAFNSIIQHIPTLRNEVDVFSIAPLDNQRKVSMNDFFDLENIPAPLTYSNIFVSRDRWIRHLFKVTNLPKKNNCIYLYNIKELIDHLSSRYLHT